MVMVGAKVTTSVDLVLAFFLRRFFFFFFLGEVADVSLLHFLFSSLSSCCCFRCSSSPVSFSWEVEILDWMDGSSIILGGSWIKFVIVLFVGVLILRFNDDEDMDAAAGAGAVILGAGGDITVVVGVGIIALVLVVPPPMPLTELIRR